MTYKKLAIPMVFASALALQGCAGVGLTMLGVGAGTTAGVGVNHTMSGVGYKTFNNSVAEVHKASNTSLRRLGMTATTDIPTESGRQITATANERDVEIELERLTAKTTRMRVVVKQGVILRDASTATEIIVQAAQALDELIAARQTGGSEKTQTKASRK